MNSEKKFPDFLLQRLSILRLAFPDHKRGPAGRFQGGKVFLIPLHVSVSLGIPEGSIRPRPDLPISAIVHVPETAMNEDDLASSLEDEVRGARQRPIVETVPIAH